MTELDGDRQGTRHSIIEWIRLNWILASVLTLVLVVFAVFWQLASRTPKFPVGGSQGDANRYLIGNVAQVIAACGAIAVIWLTARRMAAMEKQARSAQDQAVIAQEQLITAQAALEQQKVESKEQWKQAQAVLKQQRTQAEDSLELQREAARRSERSQEPERYGRAIEQVGSPSLGVRTGGLFALEALAVNAPERFAETVYENLVAYLVEHTKPKPELIEELETALQANGRSGVPADVPEAGGVPVPEIPKIGTDVHTVLKILSRQRVLFDTNITVLAQDNQEVELVDEQSPTLGTHLVGIDLSSAWLCGANFRGATFTDVNFKEARLTDTDLFDATITNVNFEEALLTKVSLCAATIVDTSFLRASIFETGFERAEMFGADFTGTGISVSRFDNARFFDSRFSASAITSGYFFQTCFVDTIFPGAQIENCSFSRATLTSTYLNDASIFKTSFRNSTLTDISFDRATLAEVKFSGASLADTNFREATFTEVNFMRARLVNTNFQGARHLRTKFSGAILTNWTGTLSPTDSE